MKRASEVDSLETTKRTKLHDSQVKSVPRGEHNHLRASFFQDAIWDLHAEAPSGYNIAVAAEVFGSADEKVFATNLRKVVTAHEILRTTFLKVGKKVVHKINNEPLTPPAIAVEDLSKVPSVELEKSILAVLTHRFDLEKGPLFQAILYKLGSNRSVLLFVAHKIICDTPSANIILSQILFPSSQQPSTLHFVDYSEWLNQLYVEASTTNPVVSSAISYWKNKLGGSLQIAQLPLDNTRPPKQSFLCSTENLAIPEDLSQKILKFSQDVGGSQALLITLLSVFKVLLHRHTGEEDITVGSTHFLHTDQTKELLGFFQDHIAYRTFLADDMNFNTVVKTVQKTVLEAEEHSHVPFHRALQALSGGDTSINHTPLFKTEFILQQTKRPALECPPGYTAKYFEIPIVLSPHDVCLTVDISNLTAFNLMVNFNSELILPLRAKEILSQYLLLLEQCISKPTENIFAYNLITPFAKSILPNPQEKLDSTWRRSIQEIFSENAKKHSSRLAIKYLDNEITYQTLSEQTNRLANLLIKKGVKPGDVVGLYGHRSPAVVVAIMGILSTGAAYSMMDPAYPTTRISACMGIAKPKAWVQIPLPSDDLQSYLDTLGLVAQVTLPQPYEDFKNSELLSCSTTYPGVTVGPEDIAVITFTSGSTGVPKGVMGRHGPLTHYYPWMQQEFGINSDDRFSMCSGIAHDPLQRDIFTPLFFGAYIYIPTQDDISQPGKLSQWFLANDINVSCFTPAIGQLLTTGVPRGFTIPSLRLAFFVGDLLFKKDVMLLYDLAPNCTVINMYGSTETQRSVGYFKAPKVGIETQKEVLPGGKGMKGAHLILLNKQLKQSGIGEVAEIYMRSHHLAKGYVGLPKDTQEKFLQNFFSTEPGDRLYKTGDLGRYNTTGDLECSGRADDQIKIRGFRIELGEISAALGKHSAVKESVTILREDRPGEKHLVSYIVPFKGATVDLPEIKRFLQTKLPHYMVPTFIVPIDAFPLTPNGKINKGGLPPPQVQQLDSSQLTPTQTKLVQIWQNELGHEIPSIDSNFFDIGGHSLHATKLTNQLRNQFKLDLNLTAIFMNPTIAQLAVVIDGMLSGSSETQTGIDLSMETRLPDEIRLRNDVQQINLRENIKSVLLTGATGFLGAFLLHSLLQQNKNVKVYCIVRASDETQAKSRIQSNLTAHKIWDSTFSSRIIPVMGDLSREYLGLSLATWDTLAQEIDIVVHNGAVVHWLQSYKQLKPVNVNGTLEILKLACTKKLKLVHYVSTTNVFETSHHMALPQVFEDDEYTGHFGLNGGYSQTKWVAEQLVRQAEKRGIPVQISRPGYVTGDSKNGVWNVDDFLCRLIKGCIQLEAHPNMHKGTLDMSAVDYVADAIIYIALNHYDITDKSFNITNDNLYTFNDWFARVKNYGYNLKELPYEEWRSTLQKNAENNALNPVVAHFSEKWHDNLQQKTRYDTTNTKKALAKSNIANPTMDQVMDKYFTYFRSCDFMAPPQNRNQFGNVEWFPKETNSAIVRSGRTLANS